MKKIVLLISVFTGVFMNAQIHDPVKWSTSVEKISANEYELIATATIDGNWHLYSQNIADDGPVPTSFVFEGSTNYLKKGNTKEGKGHENYDKIFDMQIKYFDGVAVFKQRIKIKNPKSFEVKAAVEFMVCNDTQCLPPKEVDLRFVISSN